MGKESYAFVCKRSTKALHMTTSKFKKKHLGVVGNKMIIGVNGAVIRLIGALNLLGIGSQVAS